MLLVIVYRIVEDSISRPMFVLFRSFVEMVEHESPNRSSLTDVLIELYKLEPKMGYFFLYYLRASKASDSEYSAYSEVCQAREMEVDHCLLEDLKVIASL